MKDLHHVGEIIGDRYSIIAQLGQGGNAITYQAKDLQTNQLVAIKVLSLRNLDNWKQIELFKREAKILQQLNHPHIPKYLDYFQIETESNRLFYLVQQLAPGKSLATLINEGWQPNEETIKKIAQQILEILFYLQSCIPPIIHRDIKPQNIIYDSANIFLVDFGAVQDTYHHTIMGSTVVGTYGYMAPEQFRGQAFLSTDLYGLGTTILFLLTGKHPIDLPYKKLKLQFRHLVSIKAKFANWIEILIEPNLNLRFINAEEALVVFKEKSLPSNLNNQLNKDPNYSSIKISQTKNSLNITISPALVRHKHERFRTYLLIVYYIVWFLVFLFTVLLAGSQSWICWSYGTLYILLIIFGNRLFTKYIGWILLQDIIRFLLILMFFYVIIPSLTLSILISWLFLMLDSFCHLKTRIYLLKKLFFSSRTFIKKRMLLRRDSMSNEITLKIQKQIENIWIYDYKINFKTTITSNLLNKIYFSRFILFVINDYDVCLTKSSKTLLIKELKQFIKYKKNYTQNP